MLHSNLPAEGKSISIALRQIDDQDLSDVLSAAQIEKSTRLLCDFFAAQMFGGMFGVKVDPSILTLQPSDPALKTKVSSMITPAGLESGIIL
jgi:hypothetical protein